MRAALSLVLASLFASAVPAAAAAATFTFTGGGWGHGIGLSQYGARGYALQGKSYSWILAHYYQRTRLVTKTAVTVRVHLDDQAKARSSWWIQSGTTAPLTVIEIADTAHRISLAATQTYWITTAAGNRSGPSG